MTDVERPRGDDIAEPGGERDPSSDGMRGNVEMEKTGDPASELERLPSPTDRLVRLLFSNNNACQKF
jgi:hypothetical protein